MLVEINLTVIINQLIMINLMYGLMQWIFWVGPFVGAGLAALYHQVVIRAIPFK